MIQAKENIIQGAVSKLNNETMLNISYAYENDLLIVDRRPDKCDFKDKERLSIFFISKLLERNIDWVIKQVRGSNNETIVISKYISYKIAAILFQKGIQYLDGAGNCYINSKCSLIHFKGFKISENENFQEDTNAAFSAKGIMVVFLYLSNDWFTQLTVREIEKLIGVSRGTVSQVNRKLMKLGFMSSSRQDCKIQQKHRLLETWAIQFNDKLKYKLIVGKYTSDVMNFWEKVRTDQEVISGEAGAAILLDGVNVTSGIIYTASVDEIISKYNLVESETGNIELRRKFWDDTISSNYKVNFRLLIYADIVLGYNKLEREQITKLRTLIEEGFGVRY